MEQTRRQAIAERLREGPATIDALSRDLRLPWTDVIDHLEHLRASIRPPETFHVEPPACLKCGFEFTDRKRLSRPSRCPECRGERIAPAQFSIR